MAGGADGRDDLLLVESQLRVLVEDVLPALLVQNDSAPVGIGRLRQDAQRSPPLMGGQQGLRRHPAAMRLTSIGGERIRRSRRNRSFDCIRADGDVLGDRDVDRVVALQQPLGVDDRQPYDFAVIVEARNTCPSGVASLSAAAWGPSVCR